MLKISFVAICYKIRPLMFHYYDVPLATPVEAHNNGKTVEVTVENTIDGNRPSISGAAVADVYEVSNFHFHWGAKYLKGSEHTINGKRYDLEMHIVHKNAKYETIQEALEDPFGIAVLGILFKGTKDKVNCSGLNELYDALPYLSKYNTHHEFNHTITMGSILGDLDTSEFYVYRGSLTTPPCAEAVTWFVFSDILPIEYKYLKRFWSLYDSRGVRLLNNYRPIQRTKHRSVYYAKPAE